MDLNTALQTFNTIQRPVYNTPINSIETLENKFNKLKQYTLNTQKTEDEETPQPTSTSDGFKGFTYNAPEVKQSAPLQGSDNLSKVINFFKNKNLNNIQISGIVGNLMSESSLNTSAINKEEKNANIAAYGRGIAQWSNDRVNNFKKMMGISPEKANLQQQLDFTWYEMQNRPALMKTLQNATTVKQAADAIYRGFENGSANALTTPEKMNQIYSKAWKNRGYRKYDFNTELNSRTNKAQKVFDYLNI